MSLPQDMQRSMAAEAEADREAKAKVSLATPTLQFPLFMPRPFALLFRWWLLKGSREQPRSCVKLLM